MKVHGEWKHTIYRPDLRRPLTRFGPPSPLGSVRPFIGLGHLFCSMSAPLARWLDRWLAPALVPIRLRKSDSRTFVALVRIGRRYLDYLQPDIRSFRIWCGVPSRVLASLKEWPGNTPRSPR
jgi:hypothetical protein